MKLDWHFDQQVFGLSMLVISPGFSGAPSPIKESKAQRRALVESTILAIGAATLSKSWWPIVVPAGYLAFDYLWLQNHPDGKEDDRILDPPAESVIY